MSGPVVPGWAHEFACQAGSLVNSEDFLDLLREKESQARLIEELSKAVAQFSMMFGGARISAKRWKALAKIYRYYIRAERQKCREAARIIGALARLNSKPCTTETPKGGL